MFACALLIASMVVSSDCVTVNQKNEEIISKSKVELAPMLIECSLGDIVIISTPIIHTKDKIYFLTNAQGEVRKLPIQYSQFTVKKKKRKSINFESAIIKYEKKDANVISPENSYKIFNVNFENNIPKKGFDDFERRENEMEPNEFMVGPLAEEDHGNWLLRTYFKDIDDQWIELFQVISIEILVLDSPFIEEGYKLYIITLKPERSINGKCFTQAKSQATAKYIPAYQSKPTLTVGDTFHLSFAYPITNLQSCELRAPLNTFDRYYSRNRTDLRAHRNCEFVIRNVTFNDRGVWGIIGVGRIVYMAETFLNVHNKSVLND